MRIEKQHTDIKVTIKTGRDSGHVLSRLPRLSKHEPGAPTIILYPDCFTLHNEPQIGKAALPRSTRAIFAGRLDVFPPASPSSRR